ncbi:MerR family transcriptional regulator [Geomobilimonas luticola]|uniref:MerR family transcriptional regulator n=1 Tax=Geomobilimonas luticola TaxID=1114878 RepID=A0ABS5SCE3_9BACT|nr:MerR family transcriptional regulator [Geomobilimonas luticola]MBT0653046.1 MerR family transcriptional regulator [Geomobilimonas luticola]
MPAVSPDKLYYRIGEVAAITSLRPSVLRFWESEFGMLQPRKSRSGQRLYSQENLALIQDIKRLLYVEKLTIEGARKRLALPVTAVQGKDLAGPADDSSRELLRKIKAELEQLRKIL